MHFRDFDFATPISPKFARLLIAGNYPPQLVYEVNESKTSIFFFGNPALFKIFKPYEKLNRTRTTYYVSFRYSLYIRPDSHSTIVEPVAIQKEFYEFLKQHF
jgi:hypothetical protein